MPAAARNATRRIVVPSIHRRNSVRRDVRPCNLSVGRSGATRVVDDVNPWVDTQGYYRLPLRGENVASR